MIETTSLYNGDIELEFDSSKHQYRVLKNGRRFKVPSVTSVCGVLAKPALIQWAANTSVDLCKGAISPGVEYSETYLQEVWNAARKASSGIKGTAASRGTAIHRAIESSYRGGDGDSGTLPEVEAVRNCLDELKIRVLEVERKVYSRRYRYSGTLDLLGSTEAGLVLVDFKTSKAVYPEFRLQTAAYVAAYQEECGKAITSRVIIQIADDGVKTHMYNNDATQRQDFSAFRGLLNVFNHLARIKAAEKKS